MDERHQPGRHDNAFGALRLLFASLVIVSHVPELVDGNSGREILTRLTGTTSFGTFAVNGFFVISGFLITGSFLGDRSVRSYLTKRVARIYPGFVVASLFSLLVVAPLAGAHLDTGPIRAAIAAAFRMAILARPMVAGAFPDQAVNEWGSALNGPMWSIQYEFLCYLLAILIAPFGRRRPALLVAAAALCLLAARLVPPDTLPWLQHRLFLPGPPTWLFRVVGMFLAGASFRLFQHHLRFPPSTMALSVVGLVLTIRVDILADLGMAIFGGYLIFAVAQLGGSTWLARVNNRNDVSYGVYLYAWPVQRLLMRHLGMTDLVLLTVLTWVVAVGFGWASWLLVERPALRWARERFSASSRRRTDPHVTSFQAVEFEKG